MMKEALAPLNQPLLWGPSITLLLHCGQLHTDATAFRLFVFISLEMYTLMGLV
jgi:hypothetical protein